MNCDWSLEELRLWMAKLNTPMLELILTLSAGRPAWYREEMKREIQQRRRMKK